MDARKRTIGWLSKESGFPVETLRFYEKRGLLEKPGTTPAGYRIYTSEDLSRLFFIRRAKELGFTLSEILGLLSLSRMESCDDVRRIAEDKIGQIETRLRDLTRLKGGLERIVSSCATRKGDEPCPILEDFSRNI
jgi:DNA-binding transcriptional MerR regulator